MEFTTISQTKFRSYDTSDARKINEFNRAWINANKRNLFTVLKEQKNNEYKVLAYDKETQEFICAAIVPAHEISTFELMQKTFEPMPFNIKLVARPGDRVWFIEPVMGSKDGEPMITMLRENIKSGLVTWVSGSSDTAISISIRVEGQQTEGTYVQEVAFWNKEDAEEACDNSPETGYDSWADYIKAVKGLTEYKYRLGLDHNYGDESWGRSARIARAIFHSDNSESLKVTYQNTSRIAVAKNKYVSEHDLFRREVRIVENENGVGFKQKFMREEVQSVVIENEAIGTYKEIKPHTISISGREFAKLKSEITKKRIQLGNELVQAMQSGDQSLVQCIKERKVQCDAELRLMNNIENYGLDRRKFTIC